MAGLLASADPLLAKRGAVLPAGQLETTRLRDANQARARHTLQDCVPGTRAPVQPRLAQGGNACKAVCTGILCRLHVLCCYSNKTVTLGVCLRTD